MRPGEDKAQKGDLRAVVIEFVAAGDWVTLAEIEGFLSAYMDEDGDATRFLDYDRNIVLWDGVSEDFARLVTELRDDPALTVDACSPWAYIMDGKSLKLPIAKRPPKHGYKKPHEAPVCLRPRSAV